MRVDAGTRLGPYEVIAPLGAGGMGEVFRARDTRLDRQVAIKVLPEDLAASPDFRARFEREARAVSALNHPHICTLYDVGHQDGVDFLVMELLEGESLATRLARGPLPVADAIRHGMEIADALERAHRAGIVHRDLKPGNVVLTKSGAKLLDFGLARQTPAAAPVSALSQTPTMTTPLTAQGTIVGTFQYMAPEQLEGQEADARTDIFALGAVLFEMATGKKAFDAKSQASLIAAILEREPPAVSSISPMVPPAYDQLVRACLAKDPEQRIQTAHDVKLQLKWIAEGGSAAGLPAPVAIRRRHRETTAWAIAGVAIAGVLALGYVAFANRPEPPRVMRFQIEAPPGVRNMQWPRISPDGRTLAFVGTDTAGKTEIWVRPLDALQAFPLAGTESVNRMFWSPDSRFLGFISDGKARKIAAGGGPAIVIGDAPGGSDGSWGSRGLILFDGAAIGDSIRSIPASGGTMRAASTLDRSRGEVVQGWPFFLPDGRHFLFVTYSGAGNTGTIQLGEVGGKALREFGKTDGRVEYAPQGFLVFPRENTLLAQAFDAGALRTRGDPVPIGENVALGQAAGDFSVSPGGVLAYRSQTSGELARVVLVDRRGAILSEPAPPARYTELRLSPDGHRLALGLVDPQKSETDLWIRDLDRGVTSRLTFENGDELNPVWSPDGTRLAYSSNRNGVFRPLIRKASGLGAAESLASVSRIQATAIGPSDWSRDGKRLILNVLGTTWDMWTCDPDDSSPATVLMQTPFADRFGVFSPDGRWIAYVSNESGRPEVYVQELAGAGGKWQVSVNGGSLPRWRADGKELFFQSTDQSILAVPIHAGETFQAGAPVTLFRIPLVTGQYILRAWTPTADGQRFYVLTPAQGVQAPQITIVTNWAAELAKR
jgi:eukaryotic-like serine/threonine-protein kinase